MWPRPAALSTSSRLAVHASLEHRDNSGTREAAGGERGARRADGLDQPATSASGAKGLVFTNSARPIAGKAA